MLDVGIDVVRFHRLQLLCLGASTTICKSMNEWKYSEVPTWPAYIKLIWWSAERQCTRPAHPRRPTLSIKNLDWTTEFGFERQVDMREMQTNCMMAYENIKFITIIVSDEKIAVPFLRRKLENSHHARDVLLCYLFTNHPATFLANVK